MTAFVHSPGYGASIALGPTQKVVYAFVHRRTQDGRRPEYTLGQIGDAVGKPVSSVHDALGRLRALGLIGYSARMGRTGGIRLWRVVSGVSGALDIARHRRAIARIIKRWYASPVSARAAQDHEAAPSVPLWSDRPGATERSPAPSQDDPSGVAGESSVTVDGNLNHLPSDPRPTFRELVGLHHRLPWET